MKDVKSANIEFLLSYYFLYFGLRPKKEDQSLVKRWPSWANRMLCATTIKKISLLLMNDCLE